MTPGYGPGGMHAVGLGPASSLGGKMARVIGVTADGGEASPNPRGLNYDPLTNGLSPP